MAEKSGADILVQTLLDLGVDTVFGYPGGAVLPIYDALYKHNKIKHILVRHEQAATHAAEGYARSTGKPGVVLVTSGPGATNAVTGITDALMDSIPMVVLTGQVATNLIGSDAFQEADTIGITRHCTKHNYLVKKPSDLAAVLTEAFHIATHGRPGPVVVDIPKNVQVAEAEFNRHNGLKNSRYQPQTDGDFKAVNEAVEMIMQAKAPILYTGGGIINSGPKASETLRELAELLGAPVTSTLMGLGAFPASSDQWLGMLGMHGTYEANMAMNRADLIICLGARFDDRITGRIDAFSPDSKKIHVDIDRSSVNKTIRVDLPVIGDVGRIMEQMLAVLKGRKFRAPDYEEWWARIKGWRATNCLSIPENKTEIMPQEAIRKLWEATHERNPIITTEVGQHQMWAAQHFHFEHPNKWLTSGGLGTMGYGLPAAIGAQLGHPDALVIDIAGEASIQMNIQELATASQYRLPVKIFILNNQYMGMVRQWQYLTYESRYSNSYSESLPDFIKLAESYGWTGVLIEDPADLEAGIAKMIETDGPVLVDCRVAQLANCFPMIPSGAAHTEMLLSEDDIKGSLDDNAKALV
ncbi:MAG: acetolactate synthase 3 large subunit [Sphingorhabdus sp.]|nr:acetolactate synthase 3 large subunit [Sphingorhabdus sp.]